ncbi:hypothetical protein VB713_26390, partial [Anabaena cylindrica UHCC 0172]|nr:hypothetical protein [Anabaena cylindrica UHCC 0172]
SVQSASDKLFRLFRHPVRIKTYNYEIGYNIVLDSQNRKDRANITNSGYDQLVLEDTGRPNIEGYEVPPIEPDISEDVKISYTFQEVLEKYKSGQCDK